MVTISQYTPKTNIMLSVNYNPVKNKNFKNRHKKIITQELYSVTKLGVKRWECPNSPQEAILQVKEEWS